MRWGAVKYLLMGFALAGVGFAVGAKWQGNGLGAADVFNQTVSTQQRRMKRPSR